MYMFNVRSSSTCRWGSALLQPHKLLHILVLVTKAIAIGTVVIPVCEGEKWSCWVAMAYSLVFQLLKRLTCSSSVFTCSSAWNMRGIYHALLLAWCTEPYPASHHTVTWTTGIFSSWVVRGSYILSTSLIHAIFTMLTRVKVELRAHPPRKLFCYIMFLLCLNSFYYTDLWTVFNNSIVHQTCTHAYTHTFPSVQKVRLTATSPTPTKSIS